jgi:uncharacterized membrane protein
MDFLRWLHFAHVLAAIVWIGGGVMLMLIGVRARSGTDPHAMTQFARIVPWVGIRALTPAVAVLLATGVWMVLANAAWSFSAFWVQLALGLFALAFLVGVVYMSRVGIQLNRVESSGEEQA